MIRLVSFGYKFGEPQADRVFDCRSLRNPHNDPKMRNLTGMDTKVQRFVSADTRTASIIERATEAAEPGKTIAFGCYGGRHRSVTLAELVATTLKKNGHEVEIEHRQLGEKRRVKP